MTSPFDLTGLTLLVTGAGRGLGRAAAKLLAASGAHVVGVSRTLSELATLKAEIEAAGGGADIARLDVTDRAAVRALIAGLPALDGCINNAGWNNPQHALEVDDETFDFMVDVNLRAAFTVAQAVARKLKAQGRGGSIVNMSSQMGHVGGPLRSVYCMTKFGLEGMTKAMALEWAPHGIRVNTLCPTFIRTPLGEQTLKNPERRAWILSKIKLGRVGEIEDLMGPVVFLASDASAMMTGTHLIVDGGWTAE